MKKGRLPLLEIYVANQLIKTCLFSTVVDIKLGKIYKLYRTFKYFPKVLQCIHSLQNRLINCTIVYNLCRQIVTMRDFVFNLHTLIKFCQLEKHINTNRFSTVESMPTYKRQGKIPFH